MSAPKQFKELSDAVSKADCYCLNENPNSPFANLFMGDQTLCLKSDADGELLYYSTRAIHVGGSCSFRMRTNNDFALRSPSLSHMTLQSS